MIHSFATLTLIDQEIVTCERIHKLHESSIGAFEIGTLAYGTRCISAGRLEALKTLRDQMNNQNEIALNEQYDSFVRRSSFANDLDRKL